jgi:hypothetical protein
MPGYRFPILYKHAIALALTEVPYFITNLRPRVFNLAWEHDQFVLPRNKAKAVNDYVYVHVRVGFYSREIAKINPAKWQPCIFRVRRYN